MAKRQDIDALLKSWKYEPGEVVARVVGATDGRQVVQMRIEMGLLQMEVVNRPDGTRPHNCATYFDYLKQRAALEEERLVLSPEQCMEADREFTQFYHRRMCWLALREFDKAVQDADHTLAFMDFLREHSPEEEWTMVHEQYRPFVLFHRAQAGALSKLESSGPDAAITELNYSLDRFRDLFEEFDMSERYEDDELVTRLRGLMEAIRDHYKVGRTLTEQLSDAVAAEDYERAAQIRDEMARQEAARN